MSIGPKCLPVTVNMCFSKEAKTKNWISQSQMPKMCFAASQRFLLFERAGERKVGNCVKKHGYRIGWLSINMKSEIQMKCIFDTRRLRLWPIHWYERSTWLRFDTSLNGYRFDRIRQILGIKSKHKHQYKQQKLNIWPNNEKPQFYTCLFSFRSSLAPCNQNYSEKTILHFA